LGHHVFHHTADSSSTGHHTLQDNKKINK
jgi:hypothetical protein